MAQIGLFANSLIKSYVTKVAKYFPWWDNLKTNCTYGITTLGMVAIGTSQALGFSLACAPCDDYEDCGDFEGKENVFSKDDQGWVNSHCTFDYGASDVHATFMSQFPMLLVAIALFMLLVDQGIMTICKSNNSMGNLHKMLEHIADKEKDKNEKTVELLQSFASNSSCNFFVAYVLRAVIEGIVASGLLFSIIFFGIIPNNPETWQCSIGTSEFLCANHRVEIYTAFMYLASIMLAIQAICAYGSLIWFCPCFGKLDGIMSNLKFDLSEMRFHSGDDNEHTIDIEELYYHDKNFKLMFDILSETNGVESCLQIFCLLDKNVHKLCQADNLKITQRVKNAIVKFDGAPAFKVMDDENCIFTVEITPNVLSGSTKALDGNTQVEETDVESGIQLRKPLNMETTFENLELSEDYTIKIDSIINGKTMTCKQTKFRLTPNTTSPTQNTCV